MARVSKRAIWMWTAGKIIKGTGVFIIAFWFLTAVFFIYFAPQKNLGPTLDTALIFDKWAFLGFSVALVFLLLTAASNSFYKYWSLSYELEEAALKVVKGFYEKKESYIPYKNIQSVDVQMSAGERFWGLATVFIYTSGVGDKTNPELAEGYIDGLSYNDAIALKNELMKRENGEFAPKGPLRGIEA